MCERVREAKKKWSRIWPAMRTAKYNVGSCLQLSANSNNHEEKKEREDLHNGEDM